MGWGLDPACSPNITYSSVLEHPREFVLGRLTPVPYSSPPQPVAISQVVTMGSVINYLLCTLPRKGWHPVARCSNTSLAWFIIRNILGVRARVLIFWINPLYARDPQSKVGCMPRATSSLGPCLIRLRWLGPAGGLPPDSGVSSRWR